MKKETRINQKTWNIVAPLFVNASALPSWGPFDVGKKLKLIKDIKNKTFLEIGCGSGRSINYLIKKGAKKVYGLDFSMAQLNEAKTFNKKAIEARKVELIYAPMESLQKITPVDIVFSVYALGWTQEPKKTLKNIYSYLKKGGKLIWSWDHTFFTDVEYEGGKYVVKRSYHQEKTTYSRTWKGSKAHFIYRKSSTWFQLLKQAGFEIIGYYEPEPENLKRGHNDPAKYYSIQKARLIPPSFIFVCCKN